MTLSDAQTALRQRLADQLKIGDYIGFFIISPKGIVVGADQDQPLGMLLPVTARNLPTASLPARRPYRSRFRSALLLPDAKGQICGQLAHDVRGRADQGRRRQADRRAGLRIRPEDEFTRILQVARFGETGETYAFDRDGLLLSESRFDDELKQLGLLVDQPDAQSILTVELRDPQA